MGNLQTIVQSIDTIEDMQQLLTFVRLQCQDKCDAIEDNELAAQWHKIAASLPAVDVSLIP